jgi:hypothetical protein
MILRFNLLVLEKETECNPIAMVEALRYYYDKVLVPSRRHSKYYKALKSPLAGYSYILDPNQLFSSKCDVTYKAQYIRLAGRRNYSDFKLYGRTYLDLTYFSDINIDAVKHNPLLKIENNKIYFNLEENYGNLIRRNQRQSTI